jgi:hypothetical protein
MVVFVLHTVSVYVSVYLVTLSIAVGHMKLQLVEALHYKPEGHRFDCQ